MFKISPIQDEETKKKYAELCGTEARDGFFAYAMTDIETGELMGFSQFEIGADIGYISDIRKAGELNDFEAMFILGRQTMNFIDLCSVHKVRADANTADEKLLHAIGMRKTEGGEYFCDMTGMFDGKCDGKSVEL